MHPLRFLILLVIFLGSPFLQAQESKLAAGQVIALRLAGVPAADQQNVSGNYTVSSSGDVKLPYLTLKIKALGLTPTEFMKKVETAYKTAEIYNNPNVTITCDAPTPSNVITVGGEVRSPANAPFRPGMNLYAAITRCGEPTGDMRRVKLLRGKTEKIWRTATMPGKKCRPWQINWRWNLPARPTFSPRDFSSPQAGNTSLR